MAVGGASPQGRDASSAVPAAADTAAFVGRTHELRELTAALDDVAAGHGQLFVLEGEPGIGKTSLATALADRAEARGFRALWGRCWEDGGAPAYWPWAQALRTYARDDVTTLDGAIIRALQRVTTVVPELANQLPDDSSVAHDHSESEQHRFAFFDAVSTILRHAATDRPLLVILDDLHAADHDTLRLLQFLARDLAGTRIMIVGTYRADDAERSGAAALLTKLAREGRELPLRGLPVADVGAFVGHIAGEEPDATVARLVHRTTGGNPFFVGSVTRLLVAEGRLDGLAGTGVDLGTAPLPLPPNVREAIQLRLAHLADDANELLRVASVLGRTFVLPVLSAVTRESAQVLLEQLHTPIDLGILVPHAEAPGRLTFEHMLVRDTLYGELSPRRRAELHDRVGVALEQGHAHEPGPHLREIAHHFLLAATPEGGISRAVDYASRAGRRAMTQAAYEDAADLFSRALATLETAEDADDARRCELLLDVGAARTRAGDIPGGRAAFLEAAALARETSMGDHLATAALGYAGMTGYHFSGRLDDTLVALLEQALVELPAGDSETRVRLLARLAVGLYWSDLDDRRYELSEEAVAMARRLGEPDTLAMALHSRRYAQWGPDDFEQRLADATQSLQLALRCGDLELAVSARRWRFTDLLELGDLAAADNELDAHDALAQRLRQPFPQTLTTQFRAVRAIMAGRFAEGEELAFEARAHAERDGNPRAHEVFGMQMLPIWRHTSDHERLRELLHSALETAPPHPAISCAKALIHVETGNREHAALLVEQVTDHDLKHLRRDMMFLPGLAFLALVVADLGDAPRGELVYGLLEPYAGRTVVAGAPAQACWGPVDHFLGILASTCGMGERASRHFEAALGLGARLGSSPVLAETRFEYGRRLRQTGSDDHADHADALLTAAHSTATALGVSRLVVRLDALDDGWTDEVWEPAATARRGGASAAGADITATRAGRPDERGPRAALRRVGDYWVLDADDGSIHLRDMKGLQHLATLLASPRRRHHVLELGAAPPSDADSASVPPSRPTELDEAGIGYATGFGDAGEVLDDTAKAAYQERLAELDRVIADADNDHDIERASSLRAERDLLIEQLAQAVGLGGRNRRAASNAERARVNVTRALRAAIRRIGDHSPATARYLERTIVTGTYCVYDPERWADDQIVRAP